MVTKEYSEASVEVLGLLGELAEEDYNKIPKSIIKFLEDCKSETYNPNIDFSAPIEEISLREKSKEILASIYMHSLCPESEKEEFLEQIKLNTEKKQEELRKKYNPDDIFKNKTVEKSYQNETSPDDTSNITVAKEKNIFIRFLDKLKSLFKH